jgi:hypothetical protein
MFHIKLALSFVIPAETSSAPAIKMSAYLIELPSEPAERFQSSTKQPAYQTTRTDLPLQLPEPQRDCEEMVRETLSKLTVLMSPDTRWHC